jgi:hypothetical protein
MEDSHIAELNIGDGNSLFAEMIDYDLPNLVNILLNGHMNGFRVENGFKRKRDSCSHTGSQADSAKSR